MRDARLADAELSRLLEALQPDETHLLVPPGFDLEAGRAPVFGATQKLSVTRLIAARADSAGTGVPVGLAARHAGLRHGERRRERRDEPEDDGLPHVDVLA